jgi:hypothetical protein
MVLFRQPRRRDHKCSSLESDVQTGRLVTRHCHLNPPQYSFQNSWHCSLRGNHWGNPVQAMDQGGLFCAQGRTTKPWAAAKEYKFRNVFLFVMYSSVFSMVIPWRTQTIAWRSNHTTEAHNNTSHLSLYCSLLVFLVRPSIQHFCNKQIDTIVLAFDYYVEVLLHICPSGSSSSRHYMNKSLAVQLFHLYGLRTVIFKFVD